MKVVVAAVKRGDAMGFRQFHNFVLKCQTFSKSRNWNSLETPDSLCIFGECRSARNALHMWAKGTLDQCHLHTVPTYFSQTLNRQLFAGEALH